MYETEEQKLAESYKSALKKLNDSKVCKENKEIILAFLDEYCDGLSISRKHKYLTCFHWFAHQLGKPFTEANREDIKALERDIDEKKAQNYSIRLRKWVDRKKPYSLETIRDRKMFLRLFYRWIYQTYMTTKSRDRLKGIVLRKIMARKPFPELVMDVVGIKPSVRKLKSKDMVCWPELLNMSQVTGNERDKALIQFLGETGMRIGELLTLKLKDMEIKRVNENVVGVVHIRESKTADKCGIRSIGIVNCVPAMMEYIKTHPQKNNPDAPLWVRYKSKHKNIDGDNLEAISNAVVTKVLKHAARRMGLHKRVNPHHFRKSRASSLAHIMTEQEIKQYLGWTPDSGVLKHYMFLDEEATNNKYWSSQGVDIEVEKEQIQEIKPVKCECGYINPAGEPFCINCKEQIGILSPRLRELNNLIDLKVERALMSRG
jgi:integrase